MLRKLRRDSGPEQREEVRRRDMGRDAILYEGVAACLSFC